MRCWTPEERSTAPNIKTHSTPFSSCITNIVDYNCGTKFVIKTCSQSLKTGQNHWNFLGISDFQPSFTFNLSMNIYKYDNQLNNS